MIAFHELILHSSHSATHTDACFVRLQFDVNGQVAVYSRKHTHHVVPLCVGDTAYGDSCNGGGRGGGGDGIFSNTIIS